MTSLAPYSWIEKIPTALLGRDQVPLTGNTPLFPWQSLAEALASQFELSHLSLSPDSWQWRNSPDLLKGIAGSPFVIGVGVAGCEGSVFFVCEQSFLVHLMGVLLHHEAHFASADSSYQTGFIHFLTMEVLEILSSLPWDKTLQLFLIPSASLPSEPMLSINITAQLPGETFHFRCFLDDAFQKNWRLKHRQPFGLSLNPQLAQRLTLPVSVYAGHTVLSYSQWKQVQPGDFLVLDACGLDPSLQSGDVMLLVHHLPIFKATLTQNAIHIKEQASLDEVTLFMPIDDDEEEDFEFDDEEDFNLEEEDFNFDEEVIETEDSPPANTEEAEGEESDAEDVEEAVSEPEKESVEKDVVATEVENIPAKKITSMQEIPLIVAVEVGRFEMSIQKLMELQAGNLLDLNVHPESGVDLIFNGSKVARGELVLLGESLGVRVTEI